MRLSPVEKRSIGLALLAAAVLIGHGCDRPAPRRTANGPASCPADAPAAAPSATPRAGPSALLISEREVVFPPVRIILEDTGPKLELLIFSENAHTDQDENHYSLRLQLDIDNVADLNGADLVQQAPDMQRKDTLDGIYLTGEKKVLQPYNLRAAFAHRGGVVTCKFDGYFLQFEIDDEQATAKLARVRATLSGKLEMEEAQRP